MYGGLFGDLPSTKKSQSSENEPQPKPMGDDTAAAPSTDTVDGDNASESSKKRPASVISSLGTAGTSMAFVPTALRNRKRINSVDGRSTTTTNKASSATSITPTVASSFVQHSTAQNQSIDDQSTPVSLIHSNQPQQAPALHEESEAMRQLHASVTDPYDPHVPNDLLAYWDRKAMQRERLELEREAKETLARQEQLRKQVEQERESLAKSGNLNEIVQHRQKTSMGGRGRGVSNLPAWLVQKQKEDNLATSSSSDVQQDEAVECTVILSNLTAPGDIDEELAAEVKEECQEQCGPVVNVVVKDAKPPLQPLVQVHVEFQEKADAEQAVRLFHGRKFGDRRITAEMMRSVPSTITIE